MLLLEHTCEIQRNTAVGTNGRRQLSSLATGVPCLFMPMGDTAAIQNGFSVSRAFHVYFNDGQDIAVSDKLVRNSRAYTVRGVQRFETVSGAHIKVAAEQETAS